MFQTVIIITVINKFKLFSHFGLNIKVFLKLPLVKTVFILLKNQMLHKYYTTTTQLPHNYHTTTTQLPLNYYTNTTQLPHDYHTNTTQLLHNIMKL